MRNAACNELPCVWAAHPCRPCSGTTYLRVGFRAGTRAKITTRHGFVKTPGRNFIASGASSRDVDDGGSGVAVPNSLELDELPQQNMREVAGPASPNRANGQVVNHVSFAGKEAVNQILDGEALGMLMRFPTGVEVAGLLLIGREGVRPVAPGAKVVELSSYLFPHLPVAWEKSGKSG
jgi:hypothetical protein